MDTIWTCEMAAAFKYRQMEELAVYRDSLSQKPRLTYLFFELTDACNLACIHCGSSASPCNRTYLPFCDIRAVLDEVAHAYPPESIMICLTGGEPLLHPDFFRIAQYSTQLGFSCGITTNGTLISKEVARKIADCGICSVTVSLDGLEDSHDWFRHQSGVFRRAVEGIQNLKALRGDRPLLQTTTVIHKKNIQQMDAQLKLMVDLEVDSWRVINLEPIGRALEHQDLLLDGEEYRKLLDFIREKRYDPGISMEVSYGCSHYLPIEYERTVRDNYYLCGSGIFVASILCNGDIYSCLDIQRRPELIQGNIRTHSFVDVWENGFEAFRKDRTEHCADCTGCPDKRYCQGDSAHTWDYDNNRPLLCLKQLLKERNL